MSIIKLTTMCEGGGIERERERENYLMGVSTSMCVRR